MYAGLDVWLALGRLEVIGPVDTYTLSAIGGFKYLNLYPMVSSTKLSEAIYIESFPSPYFITQGYHCKYLGIHNKLESYIDSFY